MRRSIAFAGILLCAIAASGGTKFAVLPNGWLIAQPEGPVVQTGTLPQGAAASPDGKSLAVVESGYNQPALCLYSTTDLKRSESIPLKGAFGRPVWIDGSHLLVAGANADALLVVDVADRSVRNIPFPKGSYPLAVATSGTTIAVSTEGDQSVRIGTLEGVAAAKPVRVGEVLGVAFSSDGKTLFASDTSSDRIEAIDARTLAAHSIETGLHPCALLVSGDTLYVAQSDADSVGVFDTSTGRRLADVYVGDPHVAGVSPNALASSGDAVFVSLGAANEIAVIRDRKVTARVPAGWYPTGVVPVGQRLFIIDGKGEGTRANPRLVPGTHGDVDYIAAIQFGSIRAYDLSSRSVDPSNPQGAAGWADGQTSAIVRKGGPIRHVFFILKENRSYDQVLGDLPQGNGDASLASFGERVTPNEHALATRFGIFDNTYVSGEVSEPGHNWADTAFDTDFIERMWPINYGGRRSADDTYSAAGIPRNGYIWQAAQNAHVSFRDYGEMTEPGTGKSGQIAARSLAGIYDRNYIGWNLDYSDLDRVKEWRREFAEFLRDGDLPQLEWMWLPNDHTYGTRPGKLSPASMVAQNDYALGEIVETISHSRVWRDSAIFVIEDDAQDGPDHVSAQRTIFFLISPYARGGVYHAHYATVGVLRTIELILGIPPLSAYDAMAVSLHAAFSSTLRLAPYTAISPKISLTTRNLKTAYAAALSAKLDFRRPDANPPGALRRIIAGSTLK